MIEQNQAEGDIDRIVWDRFFKSNAGVFVEVGAARPDYLSVSAFYRAKGWRVIAIEPNTAYHEAHRAAGNEVLPYACGDHDEDDVEFSVVNSHGASYHNGEVSFESFSSLGIKDNYNSLKSDLDITKIKVKLRRLDTIMAEHAADVRKIDVVCVDVEGWELEVLSGLNFDNFKPTALIIENMFFERSYHRFMATRGYALWKTSEFNEVFVRRDQLGLMEVFTGKALSEAFRLRRFLRSRGKAAA